jgi:CDP-6-deoxy-D-xylo-4-hexulose-3-dehydrase
MAELKIRLADSTIDDADISDLCDILSARPGGKPPRLTQGEITREFERRWAAWVGRKYACFVNSGSSANLLMFAAARERLSRPGREIVCVMPATGWATTFAPALQLQGFRPVILDVENETWGIDADAVEETLKAQGGPAVVVCVHVLGVPCRVERLRQICDACGATLLEDSCASPGSSVNGKKVGTFGDMSAFSLYFGHPVSTVEGGMVCTDDEETHHLLLMLRSHGWAADLPEKAQAALKRKWRTPEFSERFTFYVEGFNLRGDEMRARLGLSQMRKINDVMKVRKRNHRAYYDAFAKHNGRFSCQSVRAGEEPASISFGACAASREHRDRISAALTAHGIEHRPVGVGCVVRQPFWRKRFGETEKGSFPVAERLDDTAFLLPNHARLTERDIEFVAGVVFDA